MTDFRRDPVPASICGCEHSLTAHRIDLKAQPCDVGGCPCLSFDLRWLDWSEHRVIRQEVTA